MLVSLLSSPFGNCFLNKTLESDSYADDQAKEGEVWCHIGQPVKVQTQIEPQEGHDDQYEAVGAYPGYPCKELSGGPVCLDLFHNRTLFRISAR